MVNTAKHIIKQRGPFSTYSVNVSSKKIPEANVKIVEDFYKSDTISRVMPGGSRGNFVHVNKNGEKQKLNKRLLLCNIEDAHKKFKSEYLDIKVIFI